MFVKFKQKKFLLKLHLKSSLKKRGKTPSKTGVSPGMGRTFLYLFKVSRAAAMSLGAVSTSGLVAKGSVS